MKTIGLTGGIASGKTTVSKILQEFGVPVIDADMVYSRLTQMKACLAGSASCLGRNIFGLMES